MKAMRRAQSKFDSIEKIYDVEEYILQIIGEVKEHATPEELDGIKIDDEIEMYMRIKLIEQMNNVWLLCFVKIVFCLLYTSPSPRD